MQEEAAYNEEALLSAVCIVFLADATTRKRIMGERAWLL